MGGENVTEPKVPEVDSGSSPRGRGKLAHDRHVCRPPGLIPAWAGKTLLAAVNGSSLTAHPRVGGENTFGARIAATAAWLIPAWAGKTL